MGQDFQPTSSCVWQGPRGAKCMTFPEVKERPLSIGPDPGGVCELFKSLDCTGEPVRFRGSGFDFTKFQCPGLPNGFKREDYRSIGCSKA
ncbi:hypothetical protein BDU57DRAFT_184728 [Ampelomyces quisqualis]|uniref:Uncharacterized protein n=1 Tax=Ampelomyces quisqualis TaxID=50730 RepID=A0A6A5QTB6_AMPQU|nr:hypothetical protein BDU57DRAFT_184728 [Ampelomyces quisqualis]